MHECEPSQFSRKQRAMQQRQGQIQRLCLGGRIMASSSLIHFPLLPFRPPPHPPPPHPPPPPPSLLPFRPPHPPLPPTSTPPPTSLPAAPPPPSTPPPSANNGELLSYPFPSPSF